MREWKSWEEVGYYLQDHIRGELQKQYFSIECLGYFYDVMVLQNSSLRQVTEL